MGLPALALDFKHTPRRGMWLGILLLVIGAAAMAQVMYTEHMLSESIATAQRRQDSLSQRSAIQPAPQQLDDPTRQQAIQQANVILQQLALPWNTLFQALESTHEKDIALLTIQPDANKHSVRIGGEAKSLDVLLTYITQLEHSGVLNQVYLTSHEVRVEDAEKPVRFALVAHWVAQP
jgi:Tfp pilus assembly protein PilN